MARFRAGSARLRHRLLPRMADDQAPAGATKVCGSCGFPKPLDDFPARSGSADGRRSTCRVCANEYYKQWRQRQAGQVGGGSESTACTPSDVVPAGFRVKGMSVSYDKDGNVKSSSARFAPLSSGASSLLDAVVDPATWSGLADPRPKPRRVLDKDLLNVFPIGDAHIGMMSWAAETGQNFDLKIAEQNLFAAIDKLVELAPPAKQALVINVGDFVHADGKSNTTTKGTPVDVDGRWSKIITVAIRALRRIVDRCLERHETVRLVNEIGNHDANTSIFLSLCLAQFYEREPRVEVDTSPAKFHWHRFGKNLIGITHGDTVKYKDLPGIMACDRPQDWGETLHRLWLCGHVHHDQVKELHGCKVETLRTLAPGDAWHSGQGYRSGRDSKLIVLHREWGEIERHTVGIRRIIDELEAA